MKIMQIVVYANQYIQPFVFLLNIMNSESIQINAYINGLNHIQAKLIVCLAVSVMYIC